RERAVPARPVAGSQHTPRVIVVHGAKGGVGATTVAANLAAALRRTTGRRVAAIDGDVLNGGSGVLFDMTAPRSIYDLLPHAGELDPDLVDGYLVEHSSGVRVLFAPEDWTQAEAVGRDDVRRVIAGLKPYFDYQVVDTASHMTAATHAALDSADAIVLVVTPEIAALRNASRFLQQALQAGYPTDHVALVANRANAGNDITPAVIEQYLGRPIRAALPSEGKALVECLNQGQLVVTSRPDTAVAKGLIQLATSLATELGWTPAAPAALHKAERAPHRFGLPRLTLRRAAA
ncbi:MAG TPA: AAA family ATPase, partial [Solirubrobacteraceae bacterium]